MIEFKNFKKKGKHDEPDESPVYSDVRIASAAGSVNTNTASCCLTDDNVTYAQVHPPTKKKRNKGKSRCAAAEEAVYSEVKP
ncbi:uncharacterized protein ACO6RY_03226 [Pungitius sinensis]